MRHCGVTACRCLRSFDSAPPVERGFLLTIHNQAWQDLLGGCLGPRTNLLRARFTFRPLDLFVDHQSRRPDDIAGHDVHISLAFVKVASNPSSSANAQVSASSGPCDMRAPPRILISTGPPSPSAPKDRPPWQHNTLLFIFTSLHIVHCAAKCVKDGGFTRRGEPPLGPCWRGRP